MEIVEYSIITTWQIILLLSVVFMIAEIFVPSFVFFPIGVGLLISSIIAIWVPAAPDIIWISAVVIVLVFFALRRVAKPLMSSRVEKTAVDRYVGKRVVVVTPVQHHRSGEVKLYGEVWNAFACHAQQSFAQDEVALVKGIRGNKFLIEKCSEVSEDPQ